MTHAIGCCVYIDNAATRRLEILDALVESCGQELTPDLVERLAQRIYVSAGLADAPMPLEQIGNYSRPLPSGEGE